MKKIINSNFHFILIIKYNFFYRARYFVQSTVNRLQLLSEEIDKKEKIQKLKIIAKKLWILKV